ncbi:hypothetical protein [Sorangium sp. So ce1099]
MQTYPDMSGDVMTLKRLSFSALSVRMYAFYLAQRSSSLRRMDVNCGVDR